MDLSRYIDWDKVWTDEVCIDSSLDYIADSYKKLLMDFKNDDGVELLPDECEIRPNSLLFVFGEQGGQNESDSQGWSRDYTVIVTGEFDIVEIYYEQG